MEVLDDSPQLFIMILNKDCISHFSLPLVLSLPFEMNSRSVTRVEMIISIQGAEFSVSLPSANMHLSLLPRGY